MEQFDALLPNVIDSALGLRSKTYGYQYSEIFRSLMCVFFCGGSCIEDISTHLIHHLSLHPRLKTCSADTIFRAIKELTVDNIAYTSPTSENSYNFNTADKMNELLVQSLLATGGLCRGQAYDLDFGHQFIDTEKYDAKPTYKKFTGYSPGVAVVADYIVGIENRDGNANVRFYQQLLVEKWKGKAYRLVIQRQKRIEFPMSVDKVLDIAKTLSTITIELPNGENVVKTLFLTQDQKLIEPVFAALGV